MDVIEYLSQIHRYVALKEQLEEVIKDLDKKLLYNFLSEPTKEKILNYQTIYRAKIKKYVFVA